MEWEEGDAIRIIVSSSKEKNSGHYPGADVRGEKMGNFLSKKKSKLISAYLRI